jgi:hypothetical protein
MSGAIEADEIEDLMDETVNSESGTWESEEE